MTNGLPDLRELGGATQLSGGQQGLSLVEEVEHVVQPRYGCQEHPIWEQVLTRKAGKEMEVLWPLVGEDRREPSRDLGQVLLVPRWAISEQRRCEEDLERITEVLKGFLSNKSSQTSNDDRV